LSVSPQVTETLNPAIGLAQLVDRNGEHLGVVAGFVLHLQHADRAAADHRTRDQRVGGQDEHVYRIAVFRQGVGHVSVVAGIEHRGRHETVDEHGAGVFVEFVFDRVRVGRNLDDDVDLVGHIALADAVQVHAVPLQAVAGLGALG
jgi:hypothetical protein